jgi:surfeit locus 1 family protein
VTDRSLLSWLRSSLPHIAAVLVLIACARLSLWQLDRAEEKAELTRQWESAVALDLSALGETDLPLYSEVAGIGRFDRERQILLDNQVRGNHPGVHVFTPFTPEGSDQIILVNRGWQPWLRRSGQWPEFDTPAEPVMIRGRISEAPRVGLQLGRADALNPQQWPNLMTYFDIERIRDAMGPAVASQVILLDPEHTAHLTGDEWRLINMGPEKHRGYAFQWASIGLAVFLIWLILTLRSFRRS